MQYHIEPFVDPKGEHRWRFKAPNGQIMCGPEEGYVELRKMQHSLASISAHLPAAIDTYLGRDRHAKLVGVSEALTNWERAVTMGTPDAPVLRQAVLESIVNTMSVEMLPAGASDAGG